MLSIVRQRFKSPWTFGVALLLLNATCNAWAKVNVNMPMPKLITSSTFNSTNRRVVSIVGLFNYGGRVLPMGAVCSEGIRFALDVMKQTPGFLDDYELVVQPFDEQCSRPKGMKNFMENAMKRNNEVQNRLPLTIGPFCTSNHYIGQLMHHLNFVGITAQAITAEIYKHHKTNYRSYYVMSPPLESMYIALAEFLKVMEWRKVAIISENSNFYVEAEKIFMSIVEGWGGQVIGVAKFPYVSGRRPSSEHIRIATADLIKFDARIIVINAATLPSLVACWLHRFGLFGPNYVLFVWSNIKFSKYSPKLGPWCTPQMLEEVLQSVIYFGWTNSMNLNKRELKDSAGVTGEQLETALEEAIIDARKTPIWFVWRSHCYDTVMVAAFALNATESILNQRNETLSDWTTAGNKFQNHGQLIHGVMTQGVYSLDVNVKLGSFKVDPETTLNTRGYMMTGFFQSAEPAPPTPIAVYYGRDGTITLGPNKTVWKTSSGLKPRDSVSVVTTNRQIIPLSGYIISTIIGAILLVTTLFLFGHHICFANKLPNISNSTPWLNLFILAGDVCLLLYVLVLPQTAVSSLENYCMAAYGCFFLGFGFILFGTTAKLELALTAFKVATHEASMREQASSRPRFKALSFLTMHKLLIAAGFVVAAFIIAVMVAWFFDDPMTVVTSRTAAVVSPGDDSLAFSEVIFECRFGSSIFATVAIGLLSACYVAFVLRAGFSSLLLRKKRFSKIEDFSLAVKCFYGSVIMMAAGAVIAGFIFQNDHMKTRIALAALIFACVVLNQAMLFWPKFRKRPDVQESTTEQTTTRSRSNLKNTGKMTTGRTRNATYKNLTQFIEC